MSADVRLENVTKRFDEVVAVDDLSLEIESGKFYALLGPSGCGKTTTLRMIGGFEEPSSGTIYLGDRTVTGLPPHKRDVNTDFQSYALFPHLTIFENVAFGLRRKGKRGAELKGQVEEMLRIVGLAGYGGRKPRQLSGGQQQRVALARALVNVPRVLLLDEPLGALDLKLRQEMQVFLKGLQQDLAMTFLYVTHDQEEALTMSDHIAVFNDGRIEQVGSPADVYERPATEFVAGFVGTSNIVERDGRRLSVRPERIALNGHGEPGTIEDVVFVGAFKRLVVRTDAGEQLTVVRPNDGSSIAPGTRVHVSWDEADAYEIQPPEQPEEQEVR
jgi:putative spermidine/putrescine transport system ATP-binding protein